MTFIASFLKFFGSKAFFISLLAFAVAVVLITLITVTILNKNISDEIETTTLWTFVTDDGSGSGDFSGSGLETLKIINWKLLEPIIIDDINPDDMEDMKSEGLFRVFPK